MASTSDRRPLEKDEPSSKELLVEAEDLRRIAFFGIAVSTIGFIR